METFVIPAVPTPCSARPSSKTGQFGAVAQRIEPRLSQKRESWSAECLPNVSLSCPKTGIKAVDVRVNAVTIQLS
jgi:hypothetical protein